MPRLRGYVALWGARAAWCGMGVLVTSSSLAVMGVFGNAVVFGCDGRLVTPSSLAVMGVVGDAVVACCDGRRRGDAVVVAPEWEEGCHKRASLRRLAKNGNPACGRQVWIRRCVVLVLPCKSFCRAGAARQPWQRWLCCPDEWSRQGRGSCRESGLIEKRV